MSRTTVYIFPEKGSGHEVAKYSNSFGSAYRVWASLGQAYLNSINAIWEKSDDLWWLIYGNRLSREEKLMLAWTFDHALLPKDHFAEMSAAMVTFNKKYPLPEKYANHIPAYAQLIDSLAEDPNIMAIGWHQTSVSLNPWWVRTGLNTETEEYDGEGRLYDLSIDTYHTWIHEYLEQDLASSI